MSGRDNERAALLTVKAGGGESSENCRRPVYDQAPQQQQPSSDTAKDSDGSGSNTDSHRPSAPQPPRSPPGRCSKSTVLTILIIMAILAGLVVFLILTPTPDRSYWLRRLNDSDRAAEAAKLEQDSLLNTTTPRGKEEEEEEEESAGKKGLSGVSPVRKKLSRLERVERWFMKKPQRDPRDYFLHGNFPHHYMLHLRAHIRGWNGAEQTTLEGEVNITLTHTGGDPKRIELNSLNNLIIETHLYYDSHDIEIPCKFSIDQKRERLIIHSKDELEIGRDYVLRIFYRTSPDLRIRGAYESWLWDETKQRKVFSLIMHNQPMDARRWLPCFDEPEYKASLTLVVNHPAGLNVIGNSGIDKRYAPTPGKKRVTTGFLPTPRIPSYLFCFSINNYLGYSMVKDGVKYTSYMGRRGDKYGNHSLQLMVNAVSNISALYPDRLLFSPARGENYTRKLDMIWVPDHSSAMENHGIIMADDGKLVNRAEFSMVNHEVSHHIFGNLITLRWWSDVWLNEALTSKTEYEADFTWKLRNEKGEERKWLENEYYEDFFRGSMRIDVYETSAPLSDPSILSREEARFGFSNAYVKGSSVLRMFEKYDRLALKKTIEFLLNNRSFENFDRDEFCSFFASFSESNATKAICDDFSLKNNYPILSVSKKEGGYEVRQRRFHRGYVDETFRDETTRWAIPLTIRWKIPHSEAWGPVVKSVMGREDDVISIDADAPILINGDGQYYYRVIYDDYTPFYTTAAALENDTAWWLIQNKLLDDALAAMVTGYLDPSVALRFVVYSGLPVPPRIYDFNFGKLLDSHLKQQQIDEWNGLEIVEQLFEQEESDPLLSRYAMNWTAIGIDVRRKCAKYGANSTSTTLDSYTRGDKVFSNEVQNFVRCDPSHQNYYQYLDWTFSSLTGYDDTIRTRDSLDLFRVAVYKAQNLDRVVQDINYKAYDIKISDDDFANIIERIFIPAIDSLKGETVNHLVKLRPEAMRIQWNNVAKAVEMERMNDLEKKKLGPAILDALLTVLHEEKGFDLQQLRRKGRNLPKQKSQDRIKNEEEALQRYYDFFLHPVSEVFEGEENVRGRRTKRGGRKTAGSDKVQAILSMLSEEDESPPFP